MATSIKTKEELAKYYSDVQKKAREQVLSYRKECSEKTGLSEEQIEKLQREGWAIREIMAGCSPDGLRFVPKTLIYSAPDY